MARVSRTPIGSDQGDSLLSRLAILSTSWPSHRRPWAGHFVADLTSALASAGRLVSVVTPQWRGDALLERSGVTLCPADVGVRARALPHAPEAWPLVLGALGRRAAALRDGQTLWVAHWWPTLIAAPQGEPCVAVLHGSDVDLAERLPTALVRGLTERCVGAIGVAEHLTRRFAALTAIPALGVCPLGAQASLEPAPTSALGGWPADPRPRVLTVGRQAPGKGIDVARAVSASLPGIAWGFVTPELGLGPEEVRRLIAQADLLVVPSREGRGLPREGLPHVITQALVAGVPVVGGPNRAVRAAMRASGQVEVVDHAQGALAECVLRALGPAHGELAHAARAAGQGLTWQSVLPRWEAAIEHALGASPSPARRWPDRRRRRYSPSY